MAARIFVTAVLATLSIASPLSIRTASNTGLPVVDLGYEVHQAISYDDTFDYYSFTNIPFAQPPLGDLRFAPPQPPKHREDYNHESPNNGSGLRICPQASTGLGAAAYYFYLNYTTAQFAEQAGVINATQLNALVDTIPLYNNGQIPPFPGYKPKSGESEDCLYLDVLVPKSIFEGRGKPSAPVIVEIYGGAYIGGDKFSVGLANGRGSPGGLLRRSNDSVIYVALNYRLGAFGWLAGPEFQAEGGAANAGLLDQRAAIEWVQKYIHLFGGDCSDVTLLGESAGGGSIEHQIMAYGGSKGSVPFQRAIPQSPGFIPMRAASYTDNTYQGFLKAANASSLAQLRSMDSLALMTANAFQVWERPNFGDAGYGPVVDGDFVPDLPGILFAQGRYDKDVELLTGQNTNEGSYFSSPLARTNEAVIAQFASLFGAGQMAAYEYIVNVLYPAVYDGSQGYNNWYERIQLINTDSAFICNDFYMMSAQANQSYGYQFNVPPGFHGQDVPYTFYADTAVNATIDGPNLLQVQNASTAHTLQDWITSFAKGSPPVSNVPLSVDLPLYDEGANIGVLNTVPGVGFYAQIKKDPANQDRCRWWQQGLFAPPTWN